MADPRRAFCKACNGHRDNVGLISWRGLCQPCAIAHVRRNVEGLVDMKDPVVTNRWRVGMILCAGGSLPETLQPRS